MKHIYKHITKHIYPILLGVFVLASINVMAQGTTNPDGFEDNSIGDWVGANTSETVTVNTTTVRTGNYSLALKTTSYSSNRYWYSNEPYVASAEGSYVHLIYWAKGTDSYNVDASMRYTTTTPPNGVGSSANGTYTAVTATSWSRITFATGNVAGRYYYPAPRKETWSPTTFYIDDLVLYTSSSSTTDILSPSAATAASGTNISGLRWTNGSDNGEGATGIQKTLIFKRTAGTVGSDDLVLNNQGNYSLTSAEGPSVVGNWTLIDASVSSLVNTYTSGTFTIGEEYAIVHRDLAYNYSSPTYATIAAPAPALSVKEVSEDVSYSNGSSFDMGVNFSTTAKTKAFRIYNTGTGVLSISDISFAGSKFSITTSPSATVAVGDSTDFVVEFLPGSVNGLFTDLLTITSDATSTPSYLINFKGARATFVLPYIYQAGVTNPVYSDTELIQDFSSLSDIPAELKLGSGAAIDDTHYYADYNVYLSEGNCLANNNSALRIGEGDNALDISLPNCGTVTIKWCSSGYRKIQISDESGNIYERSGSYLPGHTCYTTSAVINNPNATTISLDFLANDPDLLTTVYYLEITPYVVGLKSSAKDILEFSSGVTGEKVFITDKIVTVKVPAGTDLTTITPSWITVSPNATVSPAEGVTKDFTNVVKYTVTAQDGSTKTYDVSIEEMHDYGTTYYADSIMIPVDMLGDNKSLEIVESSNSTCQTPISGDGSSYTIYFLDVTDKPIEGYEISGQNEICLGSIAEYTISNAPASNSPEYVWHISGASKDLFEIVGDTIGDVLRIKAPSVMTDAAIEFSISVEFDPSNCAILKGEDTISINVTDETPEPITGLVADCSNNDLLVISAEGSSDATSYNWQFTPSRQVVVQSDNYIVINLAGNYGDIAAKVNSQNACGITEDSVNYDIDYATQQSTWTGETSNEWNDHANWTARIPKACTDVTIPDVGGGVLYPTISDSGVCHYITFEPGGAVYGLKELEYVRAYVQVDLQRNKWYTLTAPLKNMYSGDYYFTGNPRTYMRLFDDVNPDNEGDTVAVGTWTLAFANNAVPLDPGMGYGFLVDSFSYNYPNGAIYNSASKIIYFPREDSEGNLVTSVYPISGITGKPYPSLAVALPRDTSIAYRFAMENSSNELEDIAVTIKPGLNLIGNPLMTHLDFNALYASNSSKISEKVKFWNGTTFTTYMAGSGIASSMDMTYTSIPPMQSFFVDGLTGIAEGTQLNIDLEGHFITDETTKLRKTGKGVKIPVLSLRSTMYGLSSYSAVAYKDETSNSYGSEDAFKLFTQYRKVPEVYTLADGKALDINFFGSLPYTTPIGIKTDNRGVIKLDFSGADQFDDKISVTLINKKTGEQKDLKAVDTYDLEFDGTPTEDYLSIEFRLSSTTDVIEGSSSTKDVQVYAKDASNIIAISPENEKIKKMTIWEQDGRQLYNKGDINNSKHKAFITTKSKVCVVRVETVSRTLVVKVMMEK